LAAEDKLARFERTLVPHLDSAYNLARWLTQNEQDAQDVVQEAYLRAFGFFDGFRGGDGRAWLLAIVRNTCYTWIRRNRGGSVASFEEEVHGLDQAAQDPETLALRTEDARQVRQALEEVPEELRETLILREMEGLSYKQIAEMAGVPLGTVMSRLARARKRLERLLVGRGAKGVER
jgi:RNA polymerase sigma-70 factor (ECF subfamily)